MTAIDELIEDWDLELTPDRARQVRQWRVDQHCRWRAVAAYADTAWGTAWNGNQQFGQLLCEASARMLGEDPDAEPWN